MATPPPTLPGPIGTEQPQLRQVCVAALHSLGEYAPEIEPGDAQSLGSDLNQLSREVTEFFSGEESRRVRDGVRVALKEYQQQARRRLWSLRQRTESAETAIREFAVEIAAGQTTHIGGVRQELESLKAAARASDLNCIRRALNQACTGIRNSHAASLRAQRMALSQLQDEIRILRETVEIAQRERDPESGALRRECLEAEIRARSGRGEAFLVFLLSIHNLEKLRAGHPPETMLGFFEAFFKRLVSIAGKEAVIARWNPKAFALLLPAAGIRADDIGDMVRARLPGAYAVQVDGTAARLVLDLSVVVMDPAAELAAKR